MFQTSLKKQQMKEFKFWRGYGILLKIPNEAAWRDARILEFMKGPTKSTDFFCRNVGEESFQR